ncbi:MAG: glycosyltransferase [Bryobacteraceae bacterium]|nr:glycosyltransferase [Bryobacteraceae bacterium]
MRNGTAVAPDATSRLQQYRSACALALAGDVHSALPAFRRYVAGYPDDAAAHSYLLFLLHSVEDISQEQIFAEHLRWSARHGLSLASKHRANASDAERVLRVGYVSADYRAGHPVMYFFEPVLRARDRSRFHVTCYSNVAIPDAVTGQVRLLADEWREIRGRPDDEVVAQILADRIDILVDLAGHCGGSRLKVFAGKPAPVQVTWLGYPDTTGLSAIDYRITDAIVDPPGLSERFHTEQLVRLEPPGFLCYQPPAAAPPVSDLPASRAGYVTFGCFQYPGKITARMIENWARIMLGVPSSRLFLHHCFSDYAEPQGAVRNRLCAAFEGRGISADRLTFVGGVPSLRSHLELYSQVDMALDTSPFNGTTTTCEALWMGVPVITKAGHAHAGRVGASLLNQVGLDNLVTATDREYCEFATELASDLPRLTGIRAGLRAALTQSSLLDASGFTRKLENRFLRMWRDFCGAAD